MELEGSNIGINPEDQHTRVELDERARSKMETVVETENELRERIQSILQLKTWRERVSACENPEEFQTMFRELGIPGEEWKSSHWLQKKAKLPKEDGGIGISLVALVHAIQKDKRFGGYPQFVAWMEGKEEVEQSWAETVQIGRAHV